MDSFVLKKHDEQQEVEERICRIMIQQNAAFSFTQNEDFLKFVQGAHSNFKVHFILI